MAARPKNVLLLWTDQQRADTVGPDKDPRLRMPNLERLAATGALFRQGYCAQPVCSPARGKVHSSTTDPRRHDRYARTQRPNLPHVQHQRQRLVIQEMHPGV